MRRFSAWSFWGMTLVAASLAVVLGIVWGELKEARLRERAVREERDAAVEEATRLKKEQQAARGAIERAIKTAMKESEELLRELRERERLEELKKSNNPPP
jgi:hypothetical protein